jgi:opacity protein-like surface antigen
MRNILLIALISCMLIPCIAYSETQTVNVPEIEKNTAPNTSSWPRVSVAGGYWWTDAKLDVQFLASEPEVSNGVLLANKGDKISELNNDLDAGLYVVTAEAYLFWRLYVDGFVGWNDFSGEHQDSDWLPAYNPKLWYFSESDATGNVATWDANAYIRLIEEKEDKGYLDVGLGYFYYKDDIEHIENSAFKVAEWQPVNIPLYGHDSSDEFKFDGLRIGAKALIRLHDRVAIRLNGGVVPWLMVENHRYWNLREDFGPPPGLRDYGEADGFAFDIDLGLEFKITKNFYVQGGFKYIDLSADGGKLKTTWDAMPGYVQTLDHFDVDAHRGGFYIMGRVKI